jgi:ketosteroid isomerase-like protein
LVLGHVRRALELFYEPWESWRNEIDEFVHIGEDVVVTRQTGYLRGRDGIEVTARTSAVWTFREGAVSEFTHYNELEEALQAAGLEEWAVSEDDVEIVRRVLAAWNRRDPDAARIHLAPEIEWEPASPSAVERSVYRGHDEVAHAAAALWETWEVFRFDETEIRVLGDSLVWLGHVHLKGSASQVELDQVFGITFSLRGGKVVRGRAFPSWEGALEAAGFEDL